MRHGKSSWDDYTISDHERKLMETGKKRSRKMAEFIKAKNIKPQLIISSTAQRALDTANIVADVIAYDKNDIKTSKNLYHASVDDVFAELYALDNKIESVMIFGHNPCFTDFVNEFVKPELDNLPTSGLAAVSFINDKWEEITNSKFKLEFVLFPSMLRK
jgi:phosphohistidine phosphatase